MKTTRILLSALALVGTMASPVLSKDLCVQIDEGVYGGSLVVLKRVKLGPQQHGPVPGYLRRFSGSAGFTDAYPLNVRRWYPRRATSSWASPGPSRPS